MTLFMMLIYLNHSKTTTAVFSSPLIKNIFASQGFLCADQKPLSGEVKKNKTLLYSTNVNFLQIYGKYFLREKVGGELITQVFVYVMLHRRTNGFLTRFTTDFLNVTPFTEV